MEFLVAVFVLGCISVGITYLLSRLSNKKIIKYIPSIISMGIAVSLVIFARFFTTDGLDSLIMGVWSVLLFFVSIIGIIAAVVIDKLRGKRKKS